ncbi:MAG: NFACT RNA binding domain-containing protein [Lachnospiraceae bacterium]|nr:NFACT RNA binding domain-containing protein [Lachnospiraceae bacterium]
MAFDGITVAHLTQELSGALTGGCISRIIQPEKDELYLTIKNNKESKILYMSASASLPLIYLTDSKVQAPLTAPNFCMLLRKHIQGGRITAITQPSLERVIEIAIDHRDELGDPCTRRLIIELMGKHSNIILVNGDNVIMDSIKRVPSFMSSVREVLPGRDYFIPMTQEKVDPLTVSRDTIFENVLSGSGKLSQLIYKRITGISPEAAEEFCYEAGLDGGSPLAAISENEKAHLTDVLMARFKAIAEGQFAAHVVLDEHKEPRAFASLPLTMYADLESVPCDSVSEALRLFYAERNTSTRLNEKSANMRHAVSVALDRVLKKAALQEKQLKDTEKKDKYRIYGELLNAYGYAVENGASSYEAFNYYDNTHLTIPLDPTLTASENAQKYFARYQKLKRTESSLSEQLTATYADKAQLESVLEAIAIAENDADLTAIRLELENSGWLKKKYIKRGKVREEKSKPMFFRSSDGFILAVGKNNLQNDELTFKYANGGDWWFHAKGRPGSHVILKTEGKEVPDRAFEEAGALAAYYSKDSKESPKIEIDYTLRKNLKKTPGGAPGFVIYHQNYSMMAVPTLEGLERIE